MLKVKMVGDSYALLTGGADTGENGTVGLSLPAGIAAVRVNGRSFPAANAVAFVPVTAFKIGVNRLTLRRADGKNIPSEGVRLTGGLFSPAGAELPDLIAAFDRRFAELSESLADLAARVKNLEDDTGILP